MEQRSRAVPKEVPSHLSNKAERSKAKQSVVIGLCLSLMLGLAAMLALSQAVYAQAGGTAAPIGVIKHVSTDIAAVGDTVRYSITVSNNYTDSLPIAVTDTMPQDVRFAGNIQASVGGAQFSDVNNTISWDLGLKPTEQATLGFDVVVLDPVDVAKPCIGEIINVANASSPAFADAIFPGQVILKRACPDLGDAPDSTNHATGITMTAYSGPVVIARYPTVFDSTTGTPQGPRHAFPRADAWLGPQVSGERDADLLPDDDASVRNINPATNTPDKDGKDDGVLKLPNKQNCTMTTMDVQVNVVGGVKNRFLNVWIDWNRDGDWEDIYTSCPGMLAGDWVVKDFVTTLPNGVHTVTVPSFVAIDSPNLAGENWMRVTLSEAPAPKDSATQRADGRGPPTGYKFGETEDYLVRLVAPQGDPKLEMSKVASAATVAPGGMIEYTIVISNTGNGAATGINWQDPIPAGTSYVAGTLNATAPTSDDSNPSLMKWTGNIPAGGSVTIKFKVQVASDFPCNKEFNNTAQIMNASGAVGLQASAVVMVRCEPKLEIRKIADVTQTVPGGVIEYTIVVNNSGTGPAINVYVQDTIPAGTSYLPGTLNATAPTTDDSNPAVMKWNGNVAAGGNVIIKFKVRVNADFQCPGKVVNVAKLLGPNNQPLGSAEAVVDVLCHGGEPHLEIRKTANVTQTTVGGAIEFTIVVNNSGSGPAIGVSVQDPIPAGTTYVAGSLNATAPTADDSNPALMQWTGNVPAGGNVIIKFKVIVNSNFQCPGKVNNVVKLLGADGTQIGVAEASVQVNCPQGEPKLTIRKTANVSQTLPGGIIEFTIVVNNSGTAPAIGASVQDAIPAGTSYIAGSLVASAPLTDDSNPALMQWTGNVPAGGNVIIKFKVMVNKDFQCPGKVTNIARLLFNGTVQPSNEASVAVLCPQGDPKLTIRKTANPTQTVPGGIVEYTIVVQNTGTGPAIGATVIDPVPAFTSYVAGTLSATAPATDDSNPAVMKWSGNIPAGGMVTIKFKVQVSPDFQCPGKVNNVARLLNSAGQVLAGAEAGVEVGCQGGEPKLTIRKTANPTQTVPGGIVEYTITIQNSGTAAAFSVNMVDPIPAFTSYVAGSLNATAPTTDDSNPSLMKWVGNIPAGGTVTITFKVKVSPDITCPSKVINVARMLGPNGQPLGAAEALVAVLCDHVDPQDPHVTLEKSVLVEGATTAGLDGSITPGSTAVYYLTLSSSDSVSHTAHISDIIPSGLVAVAVSSSSGVANIVDSGHGVIWDGILGPGTSPVTIKILVRVDQKLECNQELVNIAKWFVQGITGQSNPVVLRYRCHDLGDAPDSTNHFGFKMNAYPGVPANYPTVFDVSAPERGPRHEFPRPFFLGKGVTPELEADQGFDGDGVNNIIPSSDQANLDKADDGLLLSTINLQHCAVSQMQVVVTISPLALSLLPNKIGYLNVWVDSNRNGDWADKFDCPQASTGVAASAVEHIVIDQVVDAGTLGAGVHILTVNTTGPVFWPTNADGSFDASWLRVTLSEQKSNKTLDGGSRGDGRGYNDPFRLGETEDYLLHKQTSQLSSDPTVNKHGEIWPDFDPTTGQRRWVVGWIINYSNGGTAAANNLHVIDSYVAPQSLIAEHSIPLVPHTHVPPTLDYTVGNLPVGGSGIVIIRTEVPWNTAPGTVLTNNAAVNSSNDGNMLNNTAVATVTVPILPPVIVTPLAGSTCSNTVTVSGAAQPGVVIDLYVDGALESSGLTTDGAGNWSHTLSLANGSHDLYAIARMGAISSAPSTTVTIIVDTTLFWDPISLRFVDDLGHVIIPSGRLDEAGWSVFLRPGHTYTVSLHVCCEDVNGQVTMEIGDISVTLSDLDGDHTFTGTFTVPEGGRFTGKVRICVTCNLIRRCSDGQVTIDPEGTVFDITQGISSKVADANVACLQAGVSAASGEQVFSLWPAEDFDQINPQTVDNTGYFSFFTPQGTYRLNVSKSGYQSYVSTDLTVVDAPVHFDVPLTPIVTKTTGEQISISDSGFEPAVITVEPGTVIEWINTGNEVHSSTSATQLESASANADSGVWDSGLLQTGESYKRELATEGTYTYQDATNPNNTATIIVKKAEATNAIFLPLVSR